VVFGQSVERAVGVNVKGHNRCKDESANIQLKGGLGYEVAAFGREAHYWVMLWRFEIGSESRTVLCICEGSLDFHPSWIISTYPLQNLRLIDVDAMLLILQRRFRVDCRDGLST
jgi:hypothetical protein